MKILISCMFLFLYSCSNNQFDSFLKKNDIPLSFDGSFALKSTQENPLLVIGENAKEKRLIKIKAKDVAGFDEAKIEIKLHILRILTQYQFSMAPYPGQLTQIINCGKNYRPVLVNQDKLSHVVGFTNSRQALTICQGDEYFYDYLLSFYFFKENKKLVILELYQPKDSSASLIDSVLKKYTPSEKNVSLSEFASLFEFK